MGQHVNRQRETRAEASSTSALPQFGGNTVPSEMPTSQMKEVFPGASQDVENGACSYPPGAHMHHKSS